MEMLSVSGIFDRLRSDIIENIKADKKHKVIQH